MLNMTLLLVGLSVSQSLTRTKTTNSQISEEEEKSASLSFISSQDFTAIMGKVEILKVQNVVHFYQINMVPWRPLTCFVKIYFPDTQHFIQ